MTGNTGTAACVDPSGHGTHVAGIIAARGNNSVGVTGVCWNVQIASLRVFDSNGNVTTDRFVQALDHAEYYDIPILNYSGWFGTQIDMAAGEAIETYPGLLICAAGNDGQNINSTVHTPATFLCQNIIVVGNSTAANQRHSSSNYGNANVDLFAPGENILSCFPVSQCTAGKCSGANKGTHIANGYHKMTGTSMAAPYVTGVAALLLSKNPNINLCEIKSTIMDTVTQSAAFANICVSGGRLNAYQALSNIQNHTTIFGIEDSYQHSGYCRNDSCAFEGEFYFECHHIDYEEYSGEEHWRRCVDNCGYEDLAPHNWSYSEIYCVDCFYVVENED